MTPDISHVLRRLATLDAFQGIADSALSTLINGGKLARFSQGQTLVAADRVPSSVFLLLEGRARQLAVLDKSRDPFSLGILNPGAVAGWSSFLNDTVLEEVIAREECVALELDPQTFGTWADGHAASRRAFLESPSLPELFALLSVLPGHAETSPSARRDAAQAQLGNVRAEFTDKTGVAPTGSEMSWFVLGNGNKLPKGSRCPTPEEKATELLPAGLRILGIPTGLSEQAAAATPEPVTPPAAELPSLAESAILHQPSYDIESSGPGIPAALACFAMISRHYRRTFRASTARRVLEAKYKDHETPDLFTLGAASEVVGFHGQLIGVSREQLPAAEPPGILLWQGQPAVLLEANPRRVVIASPVSGIVEIPANEWADRLPTTLEVLLLKAPDSEEKVKFGLSWFIPALKRHKKVLIEVFIASFFVQLFALANPIVTQVIIDKVLVQNSPQTLHVLGILLAVLATAGAVTTALRTYLFVDTSNRIDLSLGTRVVDHLYRLTLGYFHKRPVGEVTSRLHELENIRQFLTGTALTVILDGIFSVIYIAIMLFYSVTLTGVALSALPLLALLTFIIAPIYQGQIRRRAQENASTQSYVVETLTGIQTVKAQNLEQRARWEWQERYARYISASFRTTVTSTTFNSISSLLGKFSDLGVLWFGAYLVIDGKMTLGQLIAFRIIAGYVTNPLLRVIQSWQNFQEVSLSIERLGDVMNSTPEQPEEASRNIPMPPIKGDVTYDDITFRYIPGRTPQLRNVSFHVPAGSFVGIVGESGSGKSTLMKLLQRLYEPESGRVMLDSYELAKVELYSLRRQIATVLQDSLLFDVSVEENIAVGDPDAPSEKIVRAATIAGAHEFIMGLSEGYRTRVGEQGRALSGGQRQRIAIARAILQEPRLIILDEATSALDFPTERLVVDNLIKEFQGRSVFFVTHRLRSVEQADLILVMDQGVIAEAGRHEDLLARRGLYFSLYQHQARA